MRIPNAIQCLTPYKGKRYARFTVVITQSGMERTLWRRELVVPDIIARTGAEAIEWVRANVALPIPDHPAEWETRGIKGGVVHRYSGWFMTIGNAMGQARDAMRQLPLFTA